MKSVKGAVLIVAVTAILASGTIAVAGTRGARDRGGPGMRDDDGSAFIITDTISSSPTQQVPALLYPGVERYLWYSVRNTTSHPLDVTSIHIVTTTAPPGCPVSELDLSGTNFVGELAVAPDASAAVPVPLSLVDTGTNQDSCEGKTFYFRFAGSAITVAPARSRTRLMTSLDPSPIGQSVTYTAFVAVEGGNGGAGHVALDGSVTFVDNGNVLCSGRALTTVSSHSSVATCTSPAYLSSGVHDVAASFESSTPDVGNSVSRTLIQVITSSTDHCRDQGRVDGDRDCDGSQR